MARRIRSIKPEILEDEDIATLPHLEWRLFVSLWVMADDYGNLRGVAAMIKGAALWGTPDAESDVQKAIDKLVAMGKLRRYEVRGQTYIHVTGWSKHQKVDKPGKPGVPGESEAETDACGIRESLANHSRERHEVPATDLDLGSGSGPGRGPGPIAVATGSESEDDLAGMVAFAYAELDAARLEIEPGSAPAQRMTERPLYDRLKSHPRGDRWRALRHACQALRVRARRFKSIDDLRMGYLGGPNAWKALLDSSASDDRKSRGGDGPGGPSRRVTGAAAGLEAIRRLQEEANATEPKP